MNTHDGNAARQFHEGTKHPNGRLMSRTHHYDYSRRPFLFKVYSKLDPIPLPLDKTARGTPALTAISSIVSPEVTVVPDLRELARILHFSAGITKHLSRGGKKLPFRAASCTGALYHIELYVVCGNLPDLDAGVYHFDVRENALRQLRAGDYRQVLVEASGEHPHVADAPALLVTSDYFFRNAIKYQARAYRHAFWDSGTILANTLSIATGDNVPATIIAGFADSDVNRLLGLDTEREAALQIVPLGHAPEMALPPAPEMPALDLDIEPVSPYERRLPTILDIHEATSLPDGEAAANWGNDSSPLALPAPTGALVELTPFEENEMPQDSVEDVITRRGSTRQYAQTPINFRQLSTILQRALGDVPADFSPLTHVYLIVNAVDGLDAGTYVYHHDRKALEMVETGDFRDDAGHLALGQALAADASVNIYFLTDLDAVLEVFGDRGYRAAQLDASIKAGRLYLASYAFELGASGLTFYDDAVTQFFSPHAEGKSVMFLMTVGVPAY